MCSINSFFCGWQKDQCMNVHQTVYWCNYRKKEEEEKEEKELEIIMSQKTSRRVSRANSRASRQSTAPAPIQVGWNETFICQKIIINW